MGAEGGGQPKPSAVEAHPQEIYSISTHLYELY